MLGNEYKDYLWWFYRHTSRINIREAPAGLTTECETPHEKLTRNYIRTLKAAYAMGDEGVIICEDDVVFVDGFLDYALDAINEMRCSELPREHNVLSFYSVSHFIGDVSLYRGRYFCSYPGMQCAGLCGIYYDRGVLESLIQYLEGHFGEQPADLMFGDWSRIEYVRYATPTGLVQHVGGVSAGTSPGHYWTDGRFNAEMKCWEPGWVPVAYSRFPFRKD